MNHKYQLTFCGRLIQENYGVPVKKALLYTLGAGINWLKFHLQKRRIMNWAS